ncbi:MAG: polysaccharide deacetylase family protein [Candidatus Portnoybacteria bacterium]|nr:polysaccharide deacetylase family protein [Candidatus Portnoybacteria bacterium]
MPQKTYILLTIVLITAIIALAGLFYWQAKRPYEFSNNPSSQNPNELPKTTENENQQATTTPIQIKGEISRGSLNKKQIIFTFDAGAGINSAQKILDTLQEHNIKGTFFATGKFAQQNPDLIKQIAAQGHEIFNHTYSHPHLTQATDEQIKEEFDKTEQIISGLTGAATKPYFRPPFGERSEHVLKVASELGYQSVYWTLDAWDWMPEATEAQVKDRIYSSLKNGAIILMHVGDNITGNILDEVFTKIENDGYKIVGLTEGLN